VKIIILGAGQVGGNLAESLVAENNDITIVDLNVERLALLQDRFDLRTVRGHAAHPSVLEQAGAEDADMLVAVTQSDETWWHAASHPPCSMCPRASRASARTISSGWKPAFWPNNSGSMTSSARNRK
jgi:voltage-gated potassium channel Kch